MQLIRYPFYLAGKLFALALIFFGGGVLATIILPFTMLIPARRSERAQSLVHEFFHFYVRMLQVLCLISLKVEGEKRLLEKGQAMIIANHPSLLDVVILMSLIPRAQCIIKSELWKHRFLGSLMRNAEYIRNDLDLEDLLSSCADAIAAKRSLIIFPEGTRSLPGRQPHFQRGFANIAILTKMPIQTVTIHCDTPFLFKGEPWWKVPPQKPFFRLVIGEYLDASSYLLYGQRSIAARKVVESLENYYAKQLGYK